MTFGFPTIGVPMQPDALPLQKYSYTLPLRSRQGEQSRSTIGGPE
jgi:hypothetical protein